MCESLADLAALQNRIIVQAKCELEDNCSICLYPLLNKPVNYLPCKHYFHNCCLKQMVENSLYTCPLCRHNLVMPLRNCGLLPEEAYALPEEAYALPEEAYALPEHNSWFNIFNELELIHNDIEYRAIVILYPVRPVASNSV